ncbi:MAG: Histidine-tRNA ligase [candidate division TM6 bacterium GW2011_GWF2_28_16]|nr:MAG: Histidine-tRNA ligase [candidate division TM6 bacterium GW2011_GWF2_28_16]
MINRVRGTQDLLDLNLQNFVLEKLKNYINLYNFKHIETPVLEYTKLFIHSLGSNTDVVSKEMYTFPAENEEDSICLRPEATSGVIRAYYENKIEEKPYKVFNYGPMFRRERPQKGRWRQFDQLNFEVINSNSIAQDVLFIKMLDSFFSQELNLESYVLKLNYLGCSQDRQKHKIALKKFLDNIDSQICDTCKTRKETNILRVFDCKNEACQKAYKDAPKLTDFLCTECATEWQELQEKLNILSINFVIDFKLVRGLDYYNKIVFEFASPFLGAQSAFCGGGRYLLGKDVGAPENFPSVGAAIGLGRLLLLVEQNIQNLNLPEQKALYLILPMEKEQHNLALLLADELIANKISIDVLLEGSSIKNMMKKANKMGAKKVLILGEDEQNTGTVTIKNMQTGESVKIKQTEVLVNL